MYKLENNVEWTDELKNAFKHGITKAKITFDNTEINYDNGLKDIEIQDVKYVPKMGFIGQATSRKATINLIDKFQDINLENKEIEIFIGADYNGSTYYINYGKFIVNGSPQNDSTNNTIKVIAYDYMVKFNKDYIDTMTYPCTLKQLLESVCEKAGVELGSQTFANDTFSVTDNQFDGKTLREILQNIAKCAFSWARIGQDNKLYLDFDIIPENTEVITIDDYMQDNYKKANEYYGPVNRVTYAETNITGQEESVPEEDSEDIIQNGLKELVIYDNLFAYTTEKRHTLIQAGERLLGLEYMPIQDLKCVGLIYLDCNDAIEVYDEQGNSITSRLFSHIIRYNGAVNDNIATEAPSNNEQIYKNKNSPILQNSRIEIVVDRATKQITSIVEEIGDRSQKTTTITQDIDGIESAVQDIEDLTNIVSGIKTVSITDAYPNNDIIELHIYGNNSVFSYLYPRTNLHPSSTLYPHGDSKIKLTNSQGEQIVDLGIIEVLRQNAEVRDEAIIDYLGNISVIRRVNKDGTTKSNPTTTQLGQAHFTLVEGTNTFEIITYSAPIEVKYAMKSTLTDIFATRIEMNSSITQTAEAINSEVRKKVDETEFGTMIEQNSEYVKIAWNQISEFIQMMSINNNATFAILNEDGQLMMTLDKKGQHFYKSDGTTMFGEMGVQKVDNQNFISFSVPTQYNSSIQDGMAWGVTTTSDGKFHPILYIKDFTMPPENSGGATGELQLDGCNLVLGAENGHIIAGGMKIVPEALGGITFAKSDDTPLLTILKGNVISGPSIYMLDNISFFKNQAGSNSFKIGDNSNYCLFADDGSINATKSVYCTGDITATNWLYGYAGIHSDGYVSGKAFIDNSRKEIKKNIEKYNENALEEILNTDIYKYNYKNEDDEKKKHIGFVIGDEYNYSKQITSLDDNNKEIGANIYSMVSIAFKAIQEQQEQIEKLQNEINKMKGENNGGVRKNDMGK